MAQATPRSKARSYFWHFLCFIIALALSGCNILVPPQPGTPPDSGGAQSSVPPQAQISFEVEVPEMNNPDQQIYIDLLDEITGLALNPTRYLLQAKDETHYWANIPVMLGAVVKYRYARGGSSSAIEYTSMGQQVRYRMLQVDGPGTVSDVVCAWNDFPHSGDVGRIMGQIKSQVDGSPLQGILVTAGGVSSISSPDGKFALEGLPTGTHNLVAYSMDGTYSIFQQGAVVQPGLETAASFSMKLPQIVKVTFNVTVPGEFVNAPVHMAGNLSNLGNAFADLYGGFSMIPAHMPLLSIVSENKYKLELNIPAGTFLTYKYSLGDGFWDSEQTTSGTFKLRYLVVPDHDVVIDDVVETWRTPNAQTVTIKVKAPAGTSPNDIVSVQFNPAFSWTEPIPMWKVGENEWLYILTSPMQFLSTVNYRFCLNDQCGIAEYGNTPGPDTQGYSFSLSDQPQTFEYEIIEWLPEG